MPDKIRLHKYISQLLKAKPEDFSEYTTAEIHKNIENYGVVVDGLKTFNRLYWCQLDSQVDFLHWPIRSKGDFEKIKIVFENQGCLVIFKPKNLVVQPGSGLKKDNLIQWLLQHYPSQLNFSSESKGLVHRIDKNTQGLLLIAKNQLALEFFQAQFKNRLVEKRYLAVVEGILEENIVIQNWQARDKQNLLRQNLFTNEIEAKKYDLKAKFASSIFYPKFVCKELGLSLVEIKIKTGRMHQIRLQAEFLGYPLQNDLVYNQKSEFLNKTLKNLDLQKIKPLIKIPNLNYQEFNNLRTKIFQDLDYSLLSNQLILKQPSGEILDVLFYQFA